ncbi:NADPH:quinone reductase [Frondihabitans sp. PAMC 28766]|uniref:zinc-binding dehydrogenase n=1 Tax=Frondihabitans sp. PAMC 28766 TaxID=1795630 RepID=UPI00078E4B0B|nr:zinc-binding dehydrogenase [Frondihabitans sp. PAMC 28766]AMM19005.1 NADPH:quinone reductase [Frondihabitans sp. PAMC 28766]
MSTTTLEVVLPGLVAPDGLILQPGSLDAPTAGRIVVRVEATGVSSAEKAMRRGRYYGQPKFPFVPGYDLVGRVEAVGDGVDRAFTGRRVAALTQHGAWATHVDIAAQDAIVVAEDVRPAEIETLIVSGVTAWQMLHRAAKRPLGAGSTIVVHGANSSVGGILAQLARRDGVRVIGTASPRHHAQLRDNDVEPLDYNDPDLGAAVRRLAPGGVDAVFDNVGGAVMHTSWRMLAPRGSLVCYAIMSTTTGDGSMGAAFVRALAWNVLRSALPNGRRATFYNIWSLSKARPAVFRRRLAQDLTALVDLVRRGDLVPDIAAELPLADVVEALTLAESRTTSGKVILLP